MMLLESKNQPLQLIIHIYLIVTKALLREDARRAVLLFVLARC